MTKTRPHIIVGCDGSPESVSALQWAAEYAQLADGNLEMVSTWDWPTFQGAPITYGRWDPKDSCNSALARLRATIDLPDDMVRMEVAQGHAGRVLVERATDADLLVVGSHGLGALSRLVLGSVSGYCATHAPSPVAVVRFVAEAQRGGVVVAVDESASARAALRWALNYADVVHQPLTVLHVAEAAPPATAADDELARRHPHAVHRRDSQWLEDVVAKEEADRGAPMTAPVDVCVVGGHPAAVLVEQSARYSLTVCGRRGSGGFPRLRLGSVAAALAHHGTSSLVVTPSA